MLLKIILFFSGTFCIRAQRSIKLCYTFGCFKSSDTQVCLTMDGDEVFYANFKNGSLIWDSKIPTAFHVPYAYSQALYSQRQCRDFVHDDWKQHKTIMNTKAPPEIIIYPRDEVMKEEDNSLICLIKKFFPPSIKIKWTKNDIEVKVEDPFIKCLPNPDGTFYVFSHLDFVPEDGDIYSCSVEHEALTEPLTKLWEVQTDEPSNGPDVFCGLGLSLGVIGVVAGAFLYVKGRQYQSTQNSAG
ncbi:H-2 class II histocompatibility antigen, A-Q alpha chain-like [Oreochromis niloticus]|uniref:H-2 class II histocompatibility antigen, A-Q alpha chain-like n=1 Tax=Oreochromis niloticus TaxID=8128 RepID=UPI00022B469E|nr:H-2 class II histocompatibility antigen, A-Q alpha chain-like [Oreochromis niloticus]CAI5675254.1 unnamed protein product [Mustela putorius furo]